MQIRSIVLTFAALVAASPAANPNRKAANLVPRQIAGLCPGIDSPLCCEAGVDGILDLTCSSPPGSPSTVDDFTSACSSEGLSAECCTLPLAGDALLCTAV